jgi:hypothetical protein
MVRIANVYAGFLLKIAQKLTLISQKMWYCTKHGDIHRIRPDLHLYPQVEQA